MDILKLFLFDEKTLKPIKHVHLHVATIKNPQCRKAGIADFWFLISSG